MRIRHFASAIALAVTAAGLSGCATGLPTQVSRYSAMPIPAGQTFYVVPAEGTQGGLEFGHFASLVSQQLEAKGFKPAGAPQLADMLVKVSYGVDEGKTEIVEDPFYDPFYGAGYGGFYRPYWSRFGYWGARSPYYWGWDDPFWYRSGYGGYGPYGMRDSIREYTVYKSDLEMKIVRRQDGAPLFEGHAKARSQTDNLGTLVPNLIEAMFTNFPGKNGETIKITVPAKKA